MNGSTKIHGSKTSTTDATWMGTKVHSHVRQAARAEIAAELAEFFLGSDPWCELEDGILADRELAAAEEAARAIGATCFVCNEYACDCPVDLVQWAMRMEGMS